MFSLYCVFCFCVSAFVGCKNKKQIYYTGNLNKKIMNRPYCYKSASDAAPNASDSAPKAIFGVFFAVRGSTLRFGFLVAVDFAVRRFAQKFAVRGSERTAKKGMIGQGLCLCDTLHVGF